MDELKLEVVSGSNLDIVSRVIGLRTQSYLKEHYGPFAVKFPKEHAERLQEPYLPPCKTALPVYVERLRERLLRIDGIDRLELY